MREKRQHTRVQLDLPCSLEPSGGTRAPGLIRDIGVGGLFVECALDLPFGASVTLEVTLPTDPTAVQLPGVVRWTKAAGFGVQFGLLGARETMAITRLLRK